MKRLSWEAREALQRVHLEREARRLRKLRAGKKRRRGTILKQTLSLLLRQFALGTGQHLPRRAIERPPQRVVFPRRFSFIEDPEKALDAAKQLTKLVVSGARDIYLDQSQCTLLGFAAESLFGALAQEAARQLRSVTFSGTLPDDPEVYSVALATGIPRQLGIELADPPDFITFPLQHGRREKERAYRSSSREKLATDLTLYINRCLEHYGHELTLEGYERIASMVGEVIGNAEDHGGAGKWWIGAYMRKLKGRIGECHLSAFNFGPSLHETLRDLPKDSRLRKDIDSLVSLHQSRGFFGGSWTEEALWTLYALQEGVSRHNTLDEIGDRGQGTADMIEFFQDIGSSLRPGLRPAMCVLSGSTYLYFDGVYRMQRQATARGEERRIIAFNRSNDLRERPDSERVRTLQARLPGTLVSFRFFLDDKYLQLIEADNGGSYDPS